MPLWTLLSPWQALPMYLVLMILTHILLYIQGINKCQGILHVFKLYYMYYSAKSYVSYIIFDMYSLIHGTLVQGLAYFC